VERLGDAVDAVAAETCFAGVVRVDDGGETVLARAYGLADRAHAVPFTIDTRVGIASGSKAFTALVVIRLVEDGALTLDTSARSLLGDDLPLIAGDVTVEHLLAHRSGIGDYLDENAGGAVTDYVMTRPVHELTTTEAFVPMLDGHLTSFAAGERFSYCNGGFVLLALLAERASGRLFHDLVDDLVLRPAGLTETAYLRLDELPGDAALGYLDDDGLRTNVLHLPVRGNGDGGAFTTAADVHRFWRALTSGRIVSARWVKTMTTPRSDPPQHPFRYGLGFWLGLSGAAVLEGCDAGASFRSVHDSDRQHTHTVLANTATGAWPIADLLGRASVGHLPDP
jgi:CubicO group peptidase (beta-lactamase class C family)